MKVPFSVFYLHAMGNPDTLRYALGGVYFHRDPSNGEQIAAATDGRRIVAATWGKEDAADVDAVIPASVCEQVIAMAAGVTNRVVMSTHEDRVALSLKNPPCNTTLDVLPLDGRFPDYRSIFTSSRDKESVALLLDVALLEEMLATFRRMGVGQVVGVFVGELGALGACHMGRTDAAQDRGRCGGLENRAAGKARRKDHGSASSYASGQHPRHDDYRDALRQQRRPLTVGSPSNSREAIR